MTEEIKTGEIKSAREELFSALSKAQAKIESVKKESDGFNYGGKKKHKYADLPSVWDVIRKPLTDNGISIHQAVKGANGDLRLVTSIHHKNGGTMTDGGVPLILIKNDMQGLGSAITYARRYGLMAAVGIAAEDEDDDGARAGEDLPEDAEPTKPQSNNKKPSITPEQKDIIVGLIKAANVDTATFCNHYGIKSVDNIPAEKFAQVKKTLDGKVEAFNKKKILMVRANG